ETRYPADYPDIAAVGPGAAVGAAGDTDAEPLLLQAPALEARGDGIDDLALHALGLGQRQSAARQRRTGQRPTLDRQQLLGEPHVVRAQSRRDRIAIGRVDLAEDDVLAWHQDRVAMEARHDLAQCGAQAGALVVDDAAAGHRKAKIDFAVALLVPAE